MEAQQITNYNRKLVRERIKEDLKQELFRRKWNNKIFWITIANNPIFFKHYAQRNDGEGGAEFIFWRT